VDTAFAKFTVGQIIHHRMFDYRGVIFDVDPEFRGSEEWYDKVALSRPPRNKPWYHVLQHGTGNITYVAERNLEPDDSGEPIAHPDIEQYFVRFEDGTYIPRERGN